MIEIILGATWACLIFYIIWYLFKAQTLHPLSSDELSQTWQQHKEQTGCTSKTIQTLQLKNNQMVGFTCNCGYNYTHKRLITQKPKTQIHPKTETESPKISDVIKSDNVIKNLGLKNAQIQKI